MKCKVGDKVKHKLGGEEMIVVAVSSKEEWVYCRRYIVNEDKFAKESFKEQELELVQEA